MCTSGHVLDMFSSGHMHMQAVELRSRLQREIAAKEKEAKERELRELAMRARMDRVGGGAPAPAASRAAGTAAAGLPSNAGKRACICHTLHLILHHSTITHGSACRQAHPFSWARQAWYRQATCKAC